MAEPEVKLVEGDKSCLTDLINKIKTILDKYPYSNNYECDIVTTMCRAKNALDILIEQVGYMKEK